MSWVQQLSGSSERHGSDIAAACCYVHCGAGADSLNATLACCLVTFCFGCGSAPAVAFIWLVTQCRPSLEQATGTGMSCYEQQQQVAAAQASLLSSQLMQWLIACTCTPYRHQQGVYVQLCHHAMLAHQTPVL